ncbi:DUF4395 domain-containing protein [Spirosoma sp. KNUC1025]|uniref:DUF4395 domain-containing protein n=1 Tax=Spirosoma sp. KNUC1025 TaxID=2894082 RepID=UPI00387090DB|nr:DUF4395 domain-containing protein [Spirosoma sp. KNUC1025]
MEKTKSNEPLNPPATFRSPTLECPVDGVKVNEYKVRTVAFLILLTTLAYLLTSYWLLPLILMVDFALRAFDYSQFSPFAQLSGRIVKTLNFPVLLIDQAPKRFAAGVGLVFAIIIIGLQGLGISTLVVAGILAVFAALESLAGFCAGCYAYTFLLPFLKK